MSFVDTAPGRLSSSTAGVALLVLLAQFGLSALLLRVVHQTNVVWLHVGYLAVITMLGIGLAIFFLRIWKRERQGGKPIFPWMLCFLFLTLLFQTMDGADVYIKKIHGGDMQPSTIAEGFSFSVQTVTTVGYGNWPFPDMKYDKRGLFELREYSIGLMIFGASLFTVVLGMTTTWLSQM